MTTTQKDITVRPIDWRSDRIVRTPWINCPWCDQEHPTEFVSSGDDWIGFCNASGRPLEATFEEDAR